ncbi:MAG: serine/threonine-protein kinase [Verrucomicrobiota bacterium]|nr:serine/threonine-protein kinase [Verrucomicrobiota bacterium]
MSAGYNDFNSREPGAIIGERYQIVRVIGRGGMGEVFLCEDLKLHKQQVAIKLLPAEILGDENAILSMQSEALSAKRLSHHNIVRLNQFDISAGGAVLEMEFVDGITLHERIYTMGKLDEKELRSIADQLCQALGYAHGLGVIHRDIKPANVLLAADPNNMTAIENLRNRPKYLKPDQYSIKLTDFGISRAPTLLGHMADEGGVSGTVQYMSPEQCKGEKTDARSDIYSLGCLLYEAAVGALPFSEGDIADFQINKHPDAPKKRGAKISKEFEAIILKCIAKNPRQRFQTMEEIRQALQSKTMVSVPDYQKQYDKAASSHKISTGIKGIGSSISNLFSGVVSLFLLLLKVLAGLAVLGAVGGGIYYFALYRPAETRKAEKAAVEKLYAEADKIEKADLRKAEELRKQATEGELKRRIEAEKPLIPFLASKSKKPKTQFLRVNVKPDDAFIGLIKAGKIASSGTRIGPLEKESHMLVIMRHGYVTKELPVDLSIQSDGVEKVLDVKMEKIIVKMPAPRSTPAPQPTRTPEASATKAAPIQTSPVPSEKTEKTESTSAVIPDNTAAEPSLATP